MTNGIFSEFWSLQTLQLCGNTISLLCFIPFAVPVSKNSSSYFWDYFSRQLHPAFRVVIFGCLICLAVVVALESLPNYPETPHFLLLGYGQLLEEQRLSDPIYYWLYWLALDWMQIGTVLMLRSSLTQKSTQRCLKNSFMLAVCISGISAIGYAINYAEPGRRVVMDSVDIVVTSTRAIVFLYSLLENRARRSFGLFACYGFCWNLLVCVNTVAAVIAEDTTLWDQIICFGDFARAVLFAPTLLIVLRSDTSWWRRNLEVVDNDFFGKVPRLIEPNTFPALVSILDQFELYWIHENLFDEKEKLAEGGFGVVAKIRYQRFFCFPSKSAAVKYLFADTSEQLIANFRTEIDMSIRAQGSKGHANVVPFYGFCLQPPVLALVFEEATDGTLAHYVSYGSSKNPLGKLELALQCIAAVKHLHSVGILHRDIKCDNFLMFKIQNKDVLKMSDFGSACLMSDEDALRQNPDGLSTPSYQAPELLKRKDHQRDCKELCSNFSEQTDIFALGCVLWTIAVSKEPFSPGQHASGLLNFDKLGHMPRDFRDLVAKCLSVDPSKRPTASDLHNILARCLYEGFEPTTSEPIQENWDDFNVSEWLRSYGCEKFDQIFKDQSIEILEQVVLLEESDLVSMGLVLGDRLLLREPLRYLRLTSRQYLTLKNNRGRRTTDAQSINVPLLDFVY